jgi:BlaI family penicillinase repressor
MTGPIDDELRLYLRCCSHLPLFDTASNFDLDGVEVMPKRPLPQPTDVELKILNVLWDHGPSTVREIHDLLAETRKTGYSTTLKMVQVMRDKGILKRDASVRPQIYRPALKREVTQVAMLDDLTGKAFSGSAQNLVLSLLSSERLSRDELKELSRMIRKAEKDRR